MNKFMFHNVGQGLFYSGHINNDSFNFIYDCGSSSNSKYINYAIDNLSTNNIIDFVVISHLHADHISGLKRLVDNYRIKKIFLPYLGQGNNNLVKLIVANSLLSTETDRDVNEVNKATRSKTQSQNLVDYDFITSLYAISKTRKQRDYDVEFIGAEGEMVKKRNNDLMFSSVKSFTSVSGTTQWKFVMMNLRQPESKLKNLNYQIDEMLKNLGDLKIDDLISSKRISIISKIYNTIFNDKEINLTSTILIHYPTSDDESSYNFTYVLPYELISHAKGAKPITILTGDALFDSELLGIMSDEITQFPSSATIFQVPHHGGIDNWNSLTTKYKYIYNYYVIPFGLGNKYCHPHKDIINELTTTKANSISLVTELYPFEYQIERK